MGTYKNQKLDIMGFLPEDAYLGEYFGKARYVRDVKAVLRGFAGIPVWKNDVECIRHKITGEVLRLKPYRYIEYRPSGRSRKFDIDCIPIRFKNRSMCYIFNLGTIFQVRKGLTQEVQDPKTIYSMQEIKQTIRDSFKELQHLPITGDVSISSLISDLKLRYMDQDEAKRCGLTSHIQEVYKSPYRKSKLSRKTITDVCTFVNILSAGKLYLFTDQAEKTGLCDVSEELANKMRDFLFIKN